MKTTFLVASLAVLIGVLATEARAYTFSLRDTVPWTAPDGRTMTIGMLYGEGIISSTPARPVVLDEQGRVVAVGPLGVDGIVRCGRADECRVLVGFSRGHRTVDPAPDTFNPFLGRPDPMDGFYVTGGDQLEFGFRRVEPTWTDEWFRWTAAYRRDPLLWLVFSAVFAALVRGSMRPLLRCKRAATGTVLDDVRAALVFPCSFLAFLLTFFYFAVGGGSELTLLPFILGSLVGVGSLCVRFSSRVEQPTAHSF